MKQYILLISLLLASAAIAGPIGGPSRSETLTLLEAWVGDGNDDVVVVNAYLDSTVTAGQTKDWGDSTSEFFMNMNRYRIRQAGTISKVSVCIGDTDNVSGYYVRIWRERSDTLSSAFDLIGSSENLDSRLTTPESCYDLTLTSPITGVEEGDYYSVYITKSTDGDGKYALYHHTPDTTNWTASYQPDSAICFMAIGGASHTRGMSWRMQRKQTGSDRYDVVVAKVWMKAPDFVFIGNSIMGGAMDSSAGRAVNHYSFLQRQWGEWSTTDWSFKNSISWIFTNEVLKGQGPGGRDYTAQNQGWYGSPIVGSGTSISNRVTTDVIPSHPKVMVIEGGINDLHSDASYASIRAAWATAINNAAAAGIKVVALKILPCDSLFAPSSVMLRRDSLNLALDTLIQGKGITVNVNDLLGTFRPTGPPENAWDIRAEYCKNTYGKIHPNRAAYKLIAHAIADSLKQEDLEYEYIYYTIRSDSSITSPIKATHFSLATQTYSGTQSGHAASWQVFPANRATLFAVCTADIPKEWELVRSDLCVTITTASTTPWWAYLASVARNWVENLSTTTPGVAHFKSRGYVTGAAHGWPSALNSCSGTDTVAWAGVTAADTTWGADSLRFFSMKADSYYVPAGAASALMTSRTIYLRCTAQLDSIRNEQLTTLIMTGARQGGVSGAQCDMYTRWDSGSSFRKPRIECLFRRKIPKTTPTAY